ncbi:cation:proton antiporter [Nocardia mangyaensis]|uniref:cation:proton antiporter n=1 Tax=Nocardia mangyaensis TaxID=2213200 RepID=UPI00267604FA|nr:cation:proton antiporter [Nocardia mangyaensis]MDO3647781.1 cation:proton antiporter [Nocardia mangyaensis]
MTAQTVGHLVLGLVVIVVIARLFGRVARWIGQPPVIGEIVAGILLGPTLFGGALTEVVFPAGIRPSLQALATVGVVLFMFLVGLELNGSLLRGHGRTASSVAIASIVLPFGLGAVLALHLLNRHPTENRLAFVLFLGAAMSVTAFPVLARILTDRGMLHTGVGALAVAVAAVDDVVAWSLLALVALVAGGATEPWRIALIAPFVALVVFGLRPVLARWAAWEDRRERAERPVLGTLARAGATAVLALGLALSASATEWMGLHLIFGAFLFGVAMPREHGHRLRAWALPLIQRVSGVLLPVFFAVAGLAVDLSTLGGAALADLLLILLVAIGGKGIGAYLGARTHRVPHRDASALAILLNTRGLTELIALTLGLKLGVIGSELYSLMVVMALVTTAMAGVLLPLVHPAREKPELPPRHLDLEEAAGPAPLAHGSDAVGTKGLP